MSTCLKCNKPIERDCASVPYCECNKLTLNGVRIVGDYRIAEKDSPLFITQSSAEEIAIKDVEQVDYQKVNDLLRSYTGKPANIASAPLVEDAFTLLNEQERYYLLIKLIYSLPPKRML